MFHITGFPRVCLPTYNFLEYALFFLWHKCQDVWIFSYLWIINSNVTSTYVFLVIYLSLTNAGGTCQLFSFYCHAGPLTTNFDGEILAIKTSLRQLSNHVDKFNKAVILVDSKPAIQAILNVSSTETRECCKIISHLQNIGKHITIQWIPSHCNIAGNEKADCLAKKGSNILQTTHKRISFSSIKQHIRKTSETLNKTRIAGVIQQQKWKSLLQNQEKITNTNRRTAIAIFRLTTGHDCLARHLNKLKILPSPFCILCGDEEEMDEEHLYVCATVSTESNITSKYWKARLLMASLLNAVH